jgi:hypothetical protein
MVQSDRLAVCIIGKLSLDGLILGPHNQTLDAFFFSFFFLHKRLEEGCEPTKRPTRHTGDVPAPDPHAGQGNPHGVKPILY